MNTSKFLEIIDSTPLVSIDLIIENKNNQFLLGKRNNRPAKGYWFVPGGRIQKNEPLSKAFERISMKEIGFKLDYKKTELLGAFDHIYTDNFHSTDGINTHYVALGHKIKLENEIQLDLDEQHSEFRWWHKEEILESPAVHDNTQEYFK